MLFTVLTLSVAVYSYAAENLTLEQAVETALRNNPGLKAADAPVEAADSGVLRSASGFLPKVTVSEIWSKTDNPLNQDRVIGHGLFVPRRSARHPADLRLFAAAVQDRGRW
jgi:outer membrane protein TolC